MGRSTAKDTAEVKVNADDAKAAEAAGGSDGVVDGHNIHSRIEELDSEEKAGPASVQTKEIRPDEREGFTGSAFDAPAAEAA